MSSCWASPSFGLRFFGQGMLGPHRDDHHVALVQPFPGPGAELCRPRLPDSARRACPSSSPWRLPPSAGVRSGWTAAGVLVAVARAAGRLPVARPARRQARAEARADPNPDAAPSPATGARWTRGAVLRDPLFYLHRSRRHGAARHRHALYLPPGASGRTQGLGPDALHRLLPGALG